jgi:hypothetical protein
MLSAVAELEFELRDAVRHPEPMREMGSHHGGHDSQIEDIVRKMEFIETTLKQVLSSGLGARQTPVVDVQPRVEELLQVEPVANSRNVLISVKNTPALAAAVAAAEPPVFDLEIEEEDETEEVEEETEEVEEGEVEEDAEEAEEAEEEEEEEVEVEVEEGEVEEDAEEVEEEEEAVEVEEFEYKGKTYQRDAEGTVYLDGEEIGTWNGKKIILS